MCWAAERGFDSDISAPSAARRYVGSLLRRVLDTAGDTEAIDDAELVISELVTNAVRTGAATVDIALRVHHGALELDVFDDGPGWPRLVQAGEQDPHGRGLVLVDAIATRWRAERVGARGKRVRVTIALPVELTRSLECDHPSAEPVEREG